MTLERGFLSEKRRVGNIFAKWQMKVIQFYVNGKTDDEVMEGLSMSYGALAAQNTRIREKIKRYYQERGVILTTKREMIVRAIITSIANNWVSTDGVNRELKAPLSESEKLIINLMLKVKKQKQIREELGVSSVNLNVLQENILAKLGAKTFYGAVATLAVLTLEGKKPY